MELEAQNPLQRVPDLPIPISLVAGRYLLFDIDAAIYLRRAHNICGYNIGTLHLIPSQNSFLGLPMIIMPEEAQLLVDQGIGYVVDDAAAHERALYNRSARQADAYQADVQRQAYAIRDVTIQAQAEKKRLALAKQGNKTLKAKSTQESQDISDDFLAFDDTESMPAANTSSSVLTNAFFVTPTTSQLLIPSQPADALNPRPALPNTPQNYPLFRHLYSRGYFMTPGLRFGCQYTTYPGDPLRFHSHFLTADFGWDKSINLMDVVGGGRLGTGVKKGFLIGGHAPNPLGSEGKHNDKVSSRKEEEVRTFSVEWAVM